MPKIIKSVAVWLRSISSEERQLDCVLGAWHQWVYTASLPPTCPPPPPPPPCCLFSLPCLWVTSMHRFRGWRGGKRQINKLSFQSLYSRRELDEEAAGMEGGFGRGVLWPAIENCCPYPERSVYTTCKVKQIDPGCRFTCAVACNPPSLSSSITEHCCWSFSLSLFRFLSLFSSHFIHVSVQNGVCVCTCVFASTFPTWMAGLDPGKHLGKPLADMEPYLKKVSEW